MRPTVTIHAGYYNAPCAHGKDLTKFGLYLAPYIISVESSPVLDTF